MVRQKVDSIQNTHPGAMIVIMGDLNGRADTPAQQVLKARKPDDGMLESGALYNTGYYLLGKPYGSYRYRGEWQTLDHVIVSGSLLNGESGVRASRKMSVYDAGFLMEEERGMFGIRPKPTYRGLGISGGIVIIFRYLLFEKIIHLQKVRTENKSLFCGKIHRTRYGRLSSTVLI